MIDPLYNYSEGNTDDYLTLHATLLTFYSWNFWWELLFPLLAFLFCFRLIFFFLFFFSGPSTSLILPDLCIKHSRILVLMDGGGSRYGFHPVLWFTSPSTGVPYTALLLLISRLYFKRSALSFLKVSIIRNYHNKNSDSRILLKHWGRGLLK